MKTCKIFFVVGVLILLYIMYMSTNSMYTNPVCADANKYEAGYRCYSDDKKKTFLKNIKDCETCIKTNYWTTIA